jgi:hypothetical protein
VTPEPEPRLQLADSVTVVPTCRVVSRLAGVERLLAESADQHLVVLLPPLGGADLTAAVAAQRLRPDRITIIRRGLPGIAGRHLERVVRVAASRGWHPTELAALAGELERHGEVDLVAPGSALRPFSGPRARLLHRAARVRWADGRWAREPASPDALEHALHQALARGRDCAVSVSGHRVPGAWAALARRSREQHAAVAVQETGFADVLGATWAIELLSGPMLDDGALSMLRERIVAAPRCGWCGTPVPGRACVRCAPGLGV